MTLADSLLDEVFLRYRWVDNANIVRAKAVYLPTVAAHVGAGADPQAVLDHAVTISQAQLALPVTGDTVVVETGLLPVHDVRLVPDWDTVHRLPYAPGHVAAACDLYDADEPWSQCPRGFLRRMAAAAGAAGLRMSVGAELEFILVRPDAVAPEQSREPDPRRRLGPVAADATPFAFEGSLDLHREFLDEVAEALQRQGVTVAQAHAESAAGQIEFSLQHAAPLVMADAIVEARQTIHAVARAHGVVATFLPLVFADAPGSALHVHMSVTGDPADGLGEVGRSFTAGLLDHLEALMAVTAPTPMSFGRYRPHFWVGAFQGWGMENKEAPLRIVTNGSGAPRDVEFKAMDATANPYTAIGCLLAAGIDGVQRGVTLPEPLVGDPGLLTLEERQRLGVQPMPNDPAAVLDAFAADGVLAAAMGAEFHQTYIAVKRAEQSGLSRMDFETRRALLLERY